MLQSSHLTGSEDELNFINRDHCLNNNNSDIAKHFHRISDLSQQKGKDGNGHFVDGRSYTDSPVQFSQCAAPNYSVKVVDVNKIRRTGIHSPGLGDNEDLAASNHSQGSNGSVRSLHAPKDPKAHTVVIPRGQKGFGIFLVEGEVSNIIHTLFNNL